MDKYFNIPTMSFHETLRKNQNNLANESKSSQDKSLTDVVESSGSKLTQEDGKEENFNLQGIGENADHSPEAPKKKKKSKKKHSKEKKGEDESSDSKYQLEDGQGGTDNEQCDGEETVVLETGAPKKKKKKSKKKHKEHKDEFESSPSSKIQREDGQNGNNSVHCDGEDFSDLGSDGPKKKKKSKKQHKKEKEKEGDSSMNSSVDVVNLHGSLIVECESIEDDFHKQVSREQKSSKNKAEGEKQDVGRDKAASQESGDSISVDNLQSLASLSLESDSGEVVDHNRKKKKRDKQEECSYSSVDESDGFVAFSPLQSVATYSNKRRNKSKWRKKNDSTLSNSEFDSLTSPSDVDTSLGTSYEVNESGDGLRKKKKKRKRQDTDNQSHHSAGEPGVPLVVDSNVLLPKRKRCREPSENEEPKTFEIIIHNKVHHVTAPLGGDVSLPSVWRESVKDKKVLENSEYVSDSDVECPPGKGGHKNTSMLDMTGTQFAVHILPDEREARKEWDELSISQETCNDGEETRKVNQRKHEYQEEEKTEKQHDGEEGEILKCAKSGEDINEGQELIECKEWKFQVENKVEKAAGNTSGEEIYNESVTENSIGVAEDGLDDQSDGRSSPIIPHTGTKHSLKHKKAQPGVSPRERKAGKSPGNVEASSDEEAVEDSVNISLSAKKHSPAKKHKKKSKRRRKDSLNLSSDGQNNNFKEEDGEASLNSPVLSSGKKKHKKSRKQKNEQNTNDSVPETSEHYLGSDTAFSPNTRNTQQQDTSSSDENVNPLRTGDAEHPGTAGSSISGLTGSQSDSDNADHFVSLQPAQVSTRGDESDAELSQELLDCVRRRRRRKSDPMYWKHCWLKSYEDQRDVTDPKMGRWSKEEVATLKANWKRFFEDNPHPEPYRVLCPKRKQAKKGGLTAFIQENNFYIRLGDNINRPLFMIYLYAKRIFHENYGSLEHDHDMELLDLHDTFQGDWQIVAEEMGRPVDVVKRRYVNINSVKGKFSDEELAKLYKVISWLKAEDDYSDERLPWKTISTHLPGRTPDAIRQQWLIKMNGGRQMVSLSMPNKGCTGRQKIQLASMIEEQGVEDESHIEWETLERGFDGEFTHSYLKMVWNNLKKRTPKHLNLQEKLKYITTELEFRK